MGSGLSRWDTCSSRRARSPSALSSQPPAPAPWCGLRGLAPRTLPVLGQTDGLQVRDRVSGPSAWREFTQSPAGSRHVQAGTGTRAAHHEPPARVAPPARGIQTGRRLPSQDCAPVPSCHRSPKALAFLHPGPLPELAAPGVTPRGEKLGRQNPPSNFCFPTLLRACPAALPCRTGY